MANPSPVPIEQSARVRGALAGASKRRVDGLIRRLNDSPPLRQVDLDRLIVAAAGHPLLDAEAVSA